MAASGWEQADISIHALREEGDPCEKAWGLSIKEFLSTPSARRATRMSECFMAWMPYFYPRPPRGGRPDGQTFRDRCWTFLSTPSARRATLSKLDIGGRQAISIHALREEGDHGLCVFVDGPGEFLSTPSARRATPCHRVQVVQLVDFYPRPPRGGRPGA